jgi:hypothetical protein
VLIASGAVVLDEGVQRQKVLWQTADALAAVTDCVFGGVHQLGDAGVGVVGHSPKDRVLCGPVV